MTPLLDLLFQEPEDELSSVLHQLRWLVIKHPIAARAACRALVAEGRRFTATDDGARWRQRLASSQLIRRGQSVWEIATLGALDSNHDQLLPTQLIDAFCRAVGRRDLEDALARRLEPSGAPP